MGGQKRDLCASGSAGGRQTTECSLLSLCAAPRTVTVISRRKKSNNPGHFVQPFRQQSFITQSGYYGLPGPGIAFINRAAALRRLERLPPSPPIGLCVARVTESRRQV